VTGSRALAEEVVQESWIAVLGGIERFEARSSLGSWLFRIVINRARSTVGRESRMVSFDLAGGDGGAEAEGERVRFQPDGHYEHPPGLWDTLDPERQIAGRQLWTHVQEAIEKLPPGPKAVIILRDIQGHEAEETCRLLGISSENQRVLLHRGRERVRRAIDALMRPSLSPG